MREIDDESEEVARDFVNGDKDLTAFLKVYHMEMEGDGSLLPRLKIC